MWVLFIPVAIVNGVIRETVYDQYLDELPSHQISTVILAVSFVLFSYVFLKNYVAMVETRRLWYVSVMWLILTVSFEFLFGHFVDKVPWEILLKDYDVLHGHMWPLFLLVQALTPFIVQKLHLNK